MYQSANVFVVLDPAPARMVEAQAGKRYYSEGEPCLTALCSFHLISFHFIISILDGVRVQPPRRGAVVLSSSLLVTLRQTRRDTRAIQI
jgi:hypothetical protein